MDSLNSLPSNIQDASFPGFSNIIHKFNALKNKFSSQFIANQNHQFKQYLQLIEHNILSAAQKKTQPKSNLLSKNTLNQKKKTLKQLQLPFEVYIYSSHESDSEHFDEAPFYISDSSISGISEENQQNLKISHKVQNMKKQIFSFAKQKRQFVQSNHKSKKIIEQLNNQKNDKKPENKLGKYLTGQLIEKIVQDQLKKYLNFVHQQSQQSSQVYKQNDIENEMSETLNEVFSRFLEDSLSEMTAKIKQNYFTSIYVPFEIDSIDQKIYLKQQQLQIKQNQLQTLTSLLNEIRNNKKIQSTLNTNQIKSYFSDLKLPNNQTNSLKSKEKSNRNILIPLLDLDSLDQQNTQKIKEQKALTSKRKYSNQTGRSHKLQNVSSKAGRRYYYDKDNRSSSRKDLAQNKSIKKVSQQAVLNKPKHIQNHEPNEQHHHQALSVKKYKFLENMYENKSPNYTTAKDEQFLSKKIGLSENITEHRSKLHLKQIQLEQEYKKNLKSVITLQIDHLKNQLDLINQELQTLQTQTQHKFLRVQVVNKFNYLKSKKDHIKSKLKSKINEFWKTAQVSNQMQSS